MELNQLRYFTVVAETENLTKAAQALYITQPALSRAISRLESELGVKLFDRKAHSLILNANGQVFLRHVSASLDALSAGVDALQRMNQHSISVANYTFLALFTVFCDQCVAAYPEIDLVEYDGGKSLVGVPAELEPDLIVTPVENEPGYIPYRAYSEPWCVVYHKDFPFQSGCDGTGITLEQLRREKICPGGFTYEREFILGILGKECCLAGDDTNSPRVVVGRCQALGILPVAAYQSLASRVPQTPIRSMQISDFTLERKIYLSYRSGFLSRSENRSVMELLDQYIQAEANSRNQEA